MLCTHNAVCAQPAAGMEPGRVGHSTALLSFTGCFDPQCSQHKQEDIKIERGYRRMLQDESA